MKTQPRRPAHHERPPHHGPIKLGALPRALKGPDDEAALFLPLYGGIEPAPERLSLEGRAPLGRETVPFGLRRARVPGTRIPVYFIEHEGFFGSRRHPYGSPAGEDYPDNDRRFVFFSRIVQSPAAGSSSSRLVPADHSMPRRSDVTSTHVGVASDRSSSENSRRAVT